MKAKRDIYRRLLQKLRSTSGAKPSPQRGSGGNTSTSAAATVAVRITREHVLLAVYPSKRGAHALRADIRRELEARGVSNPDPDAIATALRDENGKFVILGPAPDGASDDSRASRADIQVSHDGHSAHLTLTPPKPGGMDLDADALRECLRKHDVVEGVHTDVLEDVFQHPAYGTPVLVASAIQPRHGRDAEIEYGFKTDLNYADLVEVNGRVDFKEASLIQSVKAGQILASKRPATPGTEGRTVTGRPISASDGKNNVTLTAGNNTHVSADHTQLLSAIEGQPLLQAGNVSVEPVCTIEGNVDYHSGNVSFVGTVIIKGDVCEGFVVKASGDITVTGCVDAATLESSGDITIKGGVTGKAGSSLHAGKNLYAKYLENARVDVGGSVYALDGILHSHITAVDEVVCKQKRGAIVGGRIRAGVCVESRALGSAAAPETIIEVGIDPSLRERLDESRVAREALLAKLEPVRANIATLKAEKSVFGVLPPEKGKRLAEIGEALKALDKIKAEQEVEAKPLRTLLADEDEGNERASALGAALSDLEQAQEETKQERSALEEEMNAIREEKCASGRLPPKKEERLQSLCAEAEEWERDLKETEADLEEWEEQTTESIDNATVTVGKIVHPGVRITIGHVQRTLNEEHTHCTFVCEDDAVVIR